MVSSQKYLSSTQSRTFITFPNLLFIIPSLLMFSRLFLEQTLSSCFAAGDFPGYLSSPADLEVPGRCPQMIQCHMITCAVPRLQNSQLARCLDSHIGRYPDTLYPVCSSMAVSTTSRLLESSRSLFSPLLNGSSSNPLKFGSVKALSINKALSKASKLLWVACVCACVSGTGMYG